MGGLSGIGAVIFGNIRAGRIRRYKAELIGAGRSRFAGSGDLYPDLTAHYPCRFGPTCRGRLIGKSNLMPQTLAGIDRSYRPGRYTAD